MTGRVIVIPHRISGPVWLSEHVGIVEGGEKHGLAVSWPGPNDEGSLDQQYDVLDRAIEQRAGGIVLSPNVYRVFRRELLKAHEKRIPVVLEGESAGIEEMPGVSLVLSDQDETGRLVAKRLNEILGHNGEVLIVGLDPHVPGNVERSDAIVAAIEKYEPGIKVADRVSGSTSPSHSETLILQSVAAHKEAKVLISLSAGESVASASALRSGGRLAGLKIIGCDQSQSVFMLLHLGVVDSLVVQDNRGMGELAMETISDMMAHVYESRTLYVKPALVTRDNIGKEPIQQLLLMHR